MKTEHALWGIAIVLVAAFIWFHKMKVCIDGQGNAVTHSWLYPCGANEQSVTEN